MTLADRLYVTASESGIGKRAYSTGEIGAQRTDDGHMEVSIGRERSSGYYGNHKAIAWVKLSLGKAHELSALLAHLINKEFPCKGEGVQVKGSHSCQVRLNIEVSADLCTVRDKPNELREEIVQVVHKRLNEVLKDTKEKADGL